MQQVEISVQCLCLLWYLQWCYMLIVVYQNHPKYGLTIASVTVSQMMVHPNGVALLGRSLVHDWCPFQSDCMLGFMVNHECPGRLH